MEMLNSFNLLLANDLWTIIISKLAGWIVNYGWAIIVFTILLKLVLTPLDVWQRVSSQKQSKVMALMQPQMEALQKKYGDDKEKLNQEQANLYKKYNVNVGGMCFSLLFTLVITIVITFSLYGSLRALGQEKLYENYHALEVTYNEASATADSNNLVDEEKNEYVIQVVKDKYDQIKKQDGWLWVKNVWKADTNTSQFVEFESYANHYNLTGEARTQAKEIYSIITSSINKQTGEANGYFVLIVLAVLVSFVTQLISAKLLAPKGQKLTLTNWIMMIIVPITMVILVTTSNVVYTLYVIVNSIMTALISTIISLIMRNKNKTSNPEQELKKMRKIEVVEYSRNYKK